MRSSCEHVACVARVVTGVTALLAHDPAEQLGQHRVVGDRSEAVVGRIGGPLVDRAPRHVHRGELADAVAEQPEDGRAPEQVALVEPAHLDQPRVVRRPVVQRRAPGRAHGRASTPRSSTA